MAIFSKLKIHAQDKNPKDKNGITPLHLAAKNGSFNIFYNVLNCAEEKNPKDKNGITPLHLGTIQILRNQGTGWVG